HPHPASPCIQPGTVCDPACGCGNFIIVAYRELRALELRLITRRRELDIAEGRIKAEYNPRFQMNGFQDTVIKMSHFAGIEIEQWPAAIAETAMLLIDHLANQAQSELLGISMVRLPIDNKNRASIIHGNALRVDWAEAIDPNAETYVAGNPPFIGHKEKKDHHRADLKLVWGKDYSGELDYVTAWYRKSADFLASNPKGRFGFVSTNSIAQGQQPPKLFKPLLCDGWQINFAYQSFPWDTETPEKAAVHCVIIGFDRLVSAARSPELYVYDFKVDKTTKTIAKNINPYLLDAPDVFVTKRTNPKGTLSPDLPLTSFGSMPADGGHLIVEPDDYPDVAADPIAAKYLRPFRNAKELINGLDRWCLWLENATEKEILESAVLNKRVGLCRAYRENAPRGGDAYKLRKEPHLFRKNKNRPLTRYLAIPGVFSENRRWATCERFSPEIISGNALFTCEDLDGFAFAIIESAMFMAWQKAVGGRLKSDLRFSNTVVWNNLPLPPVKEELRAQIIAAGQEVLKARALYPGKSLADLYDPNAMPPELVAAHEALDVVVDKAFGAKQPCSSDEERLSILFKRYEELSKADQLPLSKGKRTSKKPRTAIR
ncbi:MAG: class I SAM-dependent DNA methyltransferase, partial [Actinomycetaceae bacterium]|nr:class I SAM-dependent DNA methyltransferase [Actinomycetaceae bacterium]